jgi:Uma2 family endonuclease
MVIQAKLYTVDEFEAIAALPENRGRLLELINGRIVEKVPTEMHGFVAIKLGRYLDIHLEENDIRGFVGAEVRHQLPDDEQNSRLPDVSVRLTGSKIVRQGAVKEMPDIAVEIQSPDDRPESVRERIEFYLQNGSRLGWILFADETAEACTLDEKGVLRIRVLSKDEVLDGGDVLPGFAVKLSKLFPQE